MSGTEVTQQEFDDAIAKYPKSKIKKFQIPVDDEGTGTMEILVKNPSREALSQYNLWSSSNQNKANEILVNDALLSSKAEVRADDYLFFGALNAVIQLIPSPKAVLVNS